MPQPDALIDDVPEGVSRDEWVLRATHIKRALDLVHGLSLDIAVEPLPVIHLDETRKGPPRHG
jgi:hypothetical protein